MSNKTPDIILEDDPIACTEVTMTIYKSVQGSYFLTEKSARYHSATHSKCDCGGLIRKGHSLCATCIEKQQIEKYLTYPEKDWDLNSIVYSHYYDKFFNDIDELEDFLACEEEEGEEIPTLTNLRLVHCQANYPREIDGDFWADDLPENQDELPKELCQKIDEFNAFLKTMKPLSYSPAKIRAIFNPTLSFLTNESKVCHD